MKKIPQLLNFYKRFLPIMENTVFLMSFEGRYCDNPKYISEKLHEIAPDIKIVWACADFANKNFPDYVIKVPQDGKEYYTYLNRAKAIVDNYVGIRSFGFRKRKSPLLEKLVTRKNQLCISTWHGTPLKKIGSSTIEDKPETYVTSCDICVAGCEYTAENLGNAYLVRDKIRVTGTPRNDILFKNDVDQEEIKNKLGLPVDKKIVLFAPTFRESVYKSGVMQFEMLDIKTILELLGNKFGGEFVFVFRVHHSVMKKIYNDDVIKDYENLVYDGNIGEDMAEYLAIADVLITDYSGSLFDFAITEKPCFLFSPDRENYEMVERGFYMDYDSLPFPISESNEKFVMDINEFSDKKYKVKVREFLKQIGNKEDGNASIRIANMIVDYISGGEKNGY